MIKWFYRNLEGDSVEMSHRVQFVPPADRGGQEGTDGMVVNAEEGTVARASVRVDDPEGTFDVAGHRIVWAQETEAEDDDYGGVIGVWYTNVRDVEEGHPWDGVGRVWTMELDDLNTVLDRRIMLGADCNRPAETDVERMQWLLATSELSIIDDDLYVSTANPVQMSANDYRKSKGRDVIDDCAQQSGKNWYVLNLNFAGHFVMWYGAGSLETFESLAKISNVPSDIEAGAYPPASGNRPTKLRLDPTRVFDKVVVDYKGGYIVSSRPQTAVDFAIGGRDTTMAAPHVTTASAARARGARYLATLSTEEFTISTAIIVDAPDVNIAYWGQRIEHRSSWMPRGFDQWTWFRIVNRTVRPLAPAVGETSGKYEIAMEIIGNAPAAPASCAATESRTDYPLGGSGTVPNPSEDGHALYLRPGIAYPESVTPGHQGQAHFPVFGAGGSGTVDQFGDCGQMTLRLIYDGDGTLTIDTVMVDAPRNLTARLMHPDPGAAGSYIVDDTQTGVSGDTFTFAFDTHGGVNCTHWVDVRDDGDICGGKWGWSSAEWDAA